MFWFVRSAKAGPSAVAALIVLLGTGCADSSDTYTLYRSSHLDPSKRIHVATFDARESGTYNFENCSLASDLYNAQDEIRVRFWCEKGRYRP
jgi:hypothetical protein